MEKLEIQKRLTEQFKALDPNIDPSRRWVDQLVDFIFELIEEVEPMDLEDMSFGMIVSHLLECYAENDVLDEIGERKIVEFLKERNYFVEDDSEDAYDTLIATGYINESLGIDTAITSNRATDCKNLIEEIVKREGWAYLYNVLEPEKEKLHLL